MTAFSLFLFFSISAVQAATPNTKDKLMQLPLRFEPNAGQFDSRVKFAAQSASYQLFLSANEAVVALPQSSFRMSLINANRNATVRGEQQLHSQSSYYIGRDRNQWKSGIQQFGKVRYSDVYPGIDVLYYGNDRSVEHDFVISAGADPAKIRMRFQNAKLQLNSAGDLLVRAGNREFVQHKPVAYQGENNVAANYRIHSNGEVSFQLGSYDPSATLVIDPVLTYSTFVGGTSADVITATTVDTDGFIWVAGYTNSRDFPIKDDSAVDTSPGNTDIFVAKLDPAKSGSDSLLYTTYIGGSGADEPRRIAFRNGNLYIAGNTTSTNFPVLGNSIQGDNKGESDTFVIYLNTRVPGKEVLWYSTYVGGALADIAQDMFVDAAGVVYVTGYTLSVDFPTAGNPVQTLSRGGQEAFFYKLDPGSPSSSAFNYSTYFGGSSTDAGYGITVDAAGLVYIAGSTTSNDFAITIGDQDRDKRGDGFIARFDVNKPGLDGLTLARYVGGATSLDVIVGIRLAAANVCVAGYTLSTDLPVSGGAPQSSLAGGVDAFVSCFDLSQPFENQLTFSTYLGGSQDDVAYAMTSDSQGRLYVAGYTFSKDFPMKTPTQEVNRGFVNSFITRIDPAANSADRISFSSYVGGNFGDFAYDIYVDPAGTKLYLAGSTSSKNFPLTTSAASGSLAGASDGFLASFDLTR